MRQNDAEVKVKKGRAERAATRRAIRRERRGETARAAANEAKDFGRGLSRVLNRYDFIVVLLVVLLSLFGIAMVFSAGYYQTINSADPNPTYYLFRQAFFVATGFVIMVIVANIDYHIYMRFANIIMIISVVVLILVMAVGSSANNAQRWIGFGIFRITPSEFCKVAMIVFTSCFLASDPDNIRSAKGLGVLFAVMAAHFILIILQPNLSTAIVIVAIMGAIMLVAGLNMLFLALPAIAGVLGYMYIMTARTPEHWYQRLSSFMDPFADRQGDGYQVTQGLIALGNGGLKGLGFGRSVAKNLYLPEPQNDFIFAIVVEELGLIGAAIILLIFALLVWRGITLSLRSKDKFGKLLGIGLTSQIGVQVVFNILVITDWLPNTGISLPFFSYGGSSLIMLLAQMGIVLSISRTANIERT